MAAMIRNERVLLLTDFFLLVISSLILNVNFVKTENSLYTDDDPMVQFNNDTIFKHLEGAKKLWMVEFYSSWCGHCQSFAPKWVDFAWQVKNWRKFSNIGVINCAAEKNFKTCMDFGIDMYPTIKFFKPNWKRPPKKITDEKMKPDKEKRKLKEKTNEFGVTYQGDKQIKLLRRSLIDQIEKESIEKLQISYVRSTDIDAILANPTPFQYLILVFEPLDSYIGRHLLLDTAESNSVIVRRVSADNKELQSKYNVVDSPSLILVKLADKKSQQLKPKELTYLSFVEALNSVAKLIDKPAPVKKDATATTTTLQPRVMSEVNINDLVGAISFSLRREVPKKPVIERRQLEALKHWVILLWKCVPVEKPLKRFLAGLNKFLNDKENTLTSKEYLSFIEVSQQRDSFLPTEIQWHGCKGSEAKFRGFPCGLWTLFHTITVTCAAKDMISVSGINVMIGIRDFIDYFFGCRYCRDHFMRMAKSIHEEVSDHDDGIIWLWKSHNRVNARLQKDISSDPAYPKVQFPPEQMCTECQKLTNAQNTIVMDPGYEVNKTKWNRRVVLEFLKEHYSPDNIRVKEAPDAGDLIQDDTDAVRNNNNSNTVHGRRKKFMYRFYPRKNSSSMMVSLIGLSRLDMSMCLFLYVVVIGSLILLYFYFLRVRRKKQFKHFV